jgi:hypothetical protein
MLKSVKETKRDNDHEIRNAEGELASGICASRYIELAAATIGGAEA